MGANIIKLPKERLFISSEVLKAVNITYRQLSYWELKGIIKPTYQKLGTRDFKRYTQQDIDTLKSIKKLLDEGYSLPTTDALKEIARRKKAEEALKESEQKFKTIFDNATDGILLADVESKKFLMGNITICQKLGYSQEEIKNLELMDIHPKKDIPYVIDQFESQVKKRSTLAKDIPVKTREGNVFYADVNSAPITLTGKRCLVGIFRDITERKKMEEEIKNLVKFPEENLNPVYRVSKNGVLLYANSASRKLILKDQTKIGDKIPEKWIGMIKNAYDSGKKQQVEVELSGRVFLFDLVPVIEGGYVNSYATDITERKKLQEEQTLRFEILKIFHQHGSLKNMHERAISLIKEYLDCDVVALRLKEDEDYPYFINNGFLEEFIESENYLCVHDEKGNCLRDSRGKLVLACMCGIVINAKFNQDKPFFTKNGSFWTNSTSDLLASTTAEDRGTTIRNVCNQYGYESVALIPIKSSGDNLGLLHITDKRRNLFASDNIKLLEELGHIIGMMIEYKWIEEKLLRSEDRYRKLLKNSDKELVKFIQSKEVS